MLPTTPGSIFGTPTHPSRHGTVLQHTPMTMYGDVGYMLCYAMLRYVMLCYAMLCYVMLHNVILCYVMLSYVMLC